MTKSTKTKRDALRGDRLACTAAVLLGAAGMALAAALPYDGSAFAPVLAAAGFAGLVRLRPTAGGRRARARRAAVSA